MVSVEKVGAAAWVGTASGFGVAFGSSLTATA